MIWVTLFKDGLWRGCLNVTIRNHFGESFLPCFLTFAR